MTVCRSLAFLLCLPGMALALAAAGDGPADNIPEKVRPVPPPGIAVPDADRTALQQGLDELGRAIDALRIPVGGAEPVSEGSYAQNCDMVRREDRTA